MLVPVLSTAFEFVDRAWKFRLIAARPIRSSRRGRHDVAAQTDASRQVGSPAHAAPETSGECLRQGRANGERGHRRGIEPVQPGGKSLKSLIPAPGAVMQENAGFAEERAIESRGALNYPLEKAKNVRTTATNLRARARPFHKCTENPSAFTLLLKPLETPARVWQAR